MREASEVRILPLVHSTMEPFEVRASLATEICEKNYHHHVKNFVHHFSIFPMYRVRFSAQRMDECPYVKILMMPVKNQKFYGHHNNDVF